MKTLLIIGIGGFAGAISRYLLGNFFQDVLGFKFPAGIFLVNILGCFFMGIVYGLVTHIDSLPKETSQLLATGFLGSFTTFSTFSLDNYVLISDGKLMDAGFNMLVSVAVGLLGVWLGYSFIKLIVK